MLLSFLNKRNAGKAALGLAFAVTLFGVGASDGDQKIGEVQLMALTNLHEIDKNNKRDIVTSRDNDDNAEITYEIVIKQNPIPGVEWVRYDREPVFESDLEMIPKDLAKKEDFKRTFKVKKGNWGKIYPVEATINWRKRTQNPGEDPKKVEWLDGKKATTVNVAYLDDKSDTRYAVTPDVSLTSLAFNHKAGCADDGFDIRKNANAATNIVAPEFEAGKDEPAAYKAGITPTIIGTFDLKPAFLNQLTVKGIGEEKPLGVVVGASNSRTGTDMVLSLTASNKIQKKITKETQPWQWKILEVQNVTLTGSYWEEIVKTSHTIYVTLDEPKAPWVQTFRKDCVLNPRIDALDFVIEKKQTMDKMKHGAQAETTELGALTEVTKLLYFIPGYKYPADRERHFIETVKLPNLDDFPIFNLTSFILDRNQNGIIPATPNCLDSSAALAIFARLLGIRNIEVIIQNMPDNPQGWGNHSYVRYADSSVFDACRGISVIGLNEPFTEYIKKWNPQIVLDQYGNHDSIIVADSIVLPLK